MGKLRKNSDGFTIVELLLVIIIVILLGFVGWYVYHTDHKTTASTKTSNTNSSTSSSTSTSTKKYFTITQWGVRAPYSGSLTLEYSIVTQTYPVDTQGDLDNVQYAGFNSDQLAASNPSACTDGDGGGSIMRYAPTDHVYGEADGTDLGTASQYFVSGNAASAGLVYNKVGNYYYQFVHVQAPCSTNTDLVSQTNNAVESLVQNLEAVPSTNQ
jgi:cytoskeletal protein RodZ